MALAPVLNDWAKSEDAKLSLLLGFSPTLLTSTVALPTVAAETTMSKVSLTESLASLAVTFTDTVSAAVGVPEKVRVAAVKLSHEGSGVASASVAV